MSARERFTADLRAVNVSLPLAISPEDPATLIDADGRVFGTIDVNRERPDAEAAKIALWTALAINLCGGFPAPTISSPDGSDVATARFRFIVSADQFVIANADRAEPWVMGRDGAFTRQGHDASKTTGGEP